MPFKTLRSPFARVTRLATAYDDATEDTDTEDTQEETVEFVIPEDFSDLNDEQLTELHAEAIGHFDSIYGDGSGFSDEELETLSQLTDGIESLQNEVTARETAEQERAEKAAKLASRAKPDADFNSDAEQGDGEDDEEADNAPDDENPEDEEADKNEDAVDESAAETVTASGEEKRKGVRLNLNSVRRRQPAASQNYANTGKPSSMKDVAFDSDSKGANWSDLAKNFDRRLASFNSQQYTMAARNGQAIREQSNLAVFHKPLGKDQMIENNDTEHIEQVMSRAVDESKLQGGSLVASGGWGAPSETLYDFLELESRDGLLSVPEVGITRGGFHFTKGPRFQDIYESTGFDFTEQDDIDGVYSDEGGEFAGNKPTYRVTTPDFEEARLDVVGLSITAGILLSRGFPEIIERTMRGALVAHDHKVSASSLARMVADSDAVTMPTPAVGAIAPILNAIELQVEHYRYAQRMPRSTTLEAIFPAWVHGAIRTDFARQGGVDEVAITDAQVTAWFRSRGVSPQFVYDWQNISGDGADFTQWPTEVSFLLYAAGTWVRGTSDIITLDSIYDSINLAQNDYIALFTEEGLLMAKRGHDSRYVTVGIETTGTTAGKVLLNHNGTPAETAPVGE